MKPETWLYYCDCKYWKKGGFCKHAFLAGHCCGFLDLRLYVEPLHDVLRSAPNHKMPKRTGRRFRQPSIESRKVRVKEAHEAYTAASSLVVASGDLENCPKLFNELTDISTLGAPCMEISSEMVDDATMALVGRSYVDQEDSEIWGVYDVAYHEQYDLVVAYIFLVKKGRPTLDDDCMFIDAKELATAPWVTWIPVDLPRTT